MHIADDVVDLSVPFHEGMPTDDLGPKIWERLGHAYSRQLYQHSQSRAGRVFLTTDHCGTHIDGPLRFDPKGTPLEQVSLERFLVPARQLDLRAIDRGRSIGRSELEEAGANQLSPGDAAVLWTGHDLYLHDPDYFWHRPHLSIDGAEFLASKRVGIVAADFPGIGRPSDDRYEVKRRLHAGGVITLEQLRGLAAVQGRPWHLFCGPLRIRGGAGSMVRACALVDWRGAELVDLTLDIYRGMPALGASPTYWTRASHELTGHFYKGKLSYQSHSLFLSEHAGTHLDPPYHFDMTGPAIDDLPLASLLVRARMLDLTHKEPLEPIGPEDLDAAMAKAGVTIGPGDGAVIWTGHSKNYYTRPDYGHYRPFITAEGAAWIVARKPAIAITDLVGLDEPIDLTTPVHNTLLHGGLCMLQVTTNLYRLAEGDWWVGAFPINIVGGTGAPLRAFAARA